MENSTTPYELAKRNYHTTCREFATAIRDEIRRLTVENFPTATGVVVSGAYDDDGEFKINLYAINLAGDTTVYEEGEGFEELEQAIDEHLLYLASTTGEDYMGRDTIDIASE